MAARVVVEVEWTTVAKEATVAVAVENNGFTYGDDKWGGSGIGSNFLGLVFSVEFKVLSLGTRSSYLHKMRLMPSDM